MGDENKLLSIQLQLLQFGHEIYILSICRIDVLFVLFMDINREKQEIFMNMYQRFMIILLVTMNMPNVYIFSSSKEYSNGQPRKSKFLEHSLFVLFPYQTRVQKEVLISITVIGPSV